HDPRGGARRGTQRGRRARERRGAVGVFAGWRRARRAARGARTAVNGEARAVHYRAGVARFEDGRAGDAHYGRIGPGYSTIRRPDPRSEAQVWDALGDARTVLNVGAGAGSYEPWDREVTAVEPSAAMRAERPPERVRAIDATAESLPFPDDHFDAAMASVTIHQWPDLEAGLREMRRVARGPVAILTFSPTVPEPWWQPVYVPELYEVEARRMPALDRVADALGGTVDIRVVPI